MKTKHINIYFKNGKVESFLICWNVQEETEYVSFNSAFDGSWYGKEKGLLIQKRTNYFHYSSIAGYSVGDNEKDN